MAVQSATDAHRLGGSKARALGPCGGVVTGGARTLWAAAEAERAAPGPGGTAAGGRRVGPGAGRLRAAALGPARRERPRDAEQEEEVQRAVPAGEHVARPRRSGPGSREAPALARLGRRAHRDVRGPGRPAPFRALSASVPPAPFLLGCSLSLPPLKHPFRDGGDGVRALYPLPRRGSRRSCRRMKRLGRWQRLCLSSSVSCWGLVGLREVGEASSPGSLCVGWDTTRRSP